MLGHHVELVDVDGAVEDAEQREADRTVAVIGRDANGSRERERRQELDADRLAVGDVVEADRREAGAGAPLDFAEKCELIGPRRTDDVGHGESGCLAKQPRGRGGHVRLAHQAFADKIRADPGNAEPGNVGVGEDTAFRDQ